MASIVQGFEYDVFISYRQKDNKGDRWVTTFVEALKTELEATFKEEISIYFDENPHDGLLETHQVDQSLAGKLKCLIFIPIISQTYCDPKSFAWKQEFCVFNMLSKADQFGRDIKLTNGNVASRILPVKIHSLDGADEKILETELASVLRGVEFIYREPGVNRPLSPDDIPTENLNKTKYRNQVNKVANAIKDIMVGLQNFGKLDFAQPVRDELAEASKAHGKSIVVLPFEDMSPEKNQEYFCDGLAEELINALSKINDLHVVSRTSSFSFKEKEYDAQLIGKKLHVTSMLEGSVRKSGSKIRITVKLINVENGFQVWSEQYDRELVDVFTTQDEISMQIVEKLSVRLDKSEAANIVKRYTQDFDAYDLFAKGRFNRNKLTEEGFLSAITFYQKAIEKDPRYALAYADMADCFVLLGWYYYVPASDAFPKAKTAAETALRLDASLGEAHTPLGVVKMVYDRDLDGAKSEFQQATLLNPNDANGRVFYSIYLGAIGQHDLSIAEARKARALDPIVPFPAINLAMRFYYARQFDLAIATLHDILKFDPSLAVVHYYLAWPYSQKGTFGQALKEVASAIETLGKKVALLNCLGIVYALSGEHELAQGVLEELLTSTKEKGISPFYVGAMYASLGNKDDAFKWLEKAYEGHDPMLIWLNVDPILDYMRTDRRFKSLLKKTGLAMDVPETSES